MRWGGCSERRRQGRIPPPGSESNRDCNSFVSSGERCEFAPFPRGNGSSPILDLMHLGGSWVRRVWVLACAGGAVRRGGGRVVGVGGQEGAGSWGRGAGRPAHTAQGLGAGQTAQGLGTGSPAHTLTGPRGAVRDLACAGRGVGRGGRRLVVHLLTETRLCHRQGVS